MRKQEEIENGERLAEKILKVVVGVFSKLGKMEERIFVFLLKREIKEGKGLCTFYTPALVP